MNRFYYLSLGSNMGNSVENLQTATALIADMALLVKASGIYITAPQGYENQADFYNQCVLVKSELVPNELLLKLQHIEAVLDRKRVIRWGPRTIDIDIIWVKGVCQSSADLILPHPRAFERAFVLLPLLELPMVDPLLTRQIAYHLPFVDNQEVRKMI